ncbi:MAG: glycosyltransferase [Planctomycetota bacterium]
MKILQVIHGYLPQFRGGTELYVQGLNHELRALGQDLAVFAGTTHNAEEARRENYVHDDVEVTQVVLSGAYLEHWTRSYSPDAARIFRDELRRIRPDLVHIHHWFRLSRNLVEICYRAGVPVVCTLHDLYVSCPTFFRIADGDFSEAPLSPDAWRDSLPRLPWMEDRDVDDEIVRFREDFENELALAHRIIVPSQAHGDLLKRVMKFPSERVRVIPHGTITPPPPKKKASRKKRSGRIQLGVWGHLFHMKGAHVLFEALQQSGVAKRFDVHVWGKVVEPRYRRLLDDVTEGLDVNWHGEFVPADIEEVDLDLAVMPSLCSESYSFVLDEAFRLGLPCLVSDRGALGERIGDAGRSFPAGDSKALAEILKKIAANPNIIDDWRTKIPALPSMKQHAEVILQLYADVIRKRDMSRLEPDVDLPRRRTEHLAHQLMRREERMFAYLGELKREQGRGDHFESETKKLIQQQDDWGHRLDETDGRAIAAERALAGKNRLVESLGTEMLDLRRALTEGGDGELRRAPEAPQVEEHVPGLGSIAAIIHENQQILEDFHSSLQSDKKLKTKNQLIQFLTREIVAFRSLAASLAQGVLDLDLEAPILPEADVDLPLLGTPAAISADNNQAMSKLVEAYASIPARFEGLINLLGREVGRLGTALAQGTSTAEARVDSILEEARAHPEFARIENYLAKSPERLSQHYESIAGQAQQLREAREQILAKDREQIERAEALRQIGEFIEELRRALNLIHQPKLNFSAMSAPAVDIPFDVPGVGDLPTIRRVNLEIIEQHLESLRELRA